ncbi:PAS domain S-box [Halovivax ruber XH-70]|uniref:PAS domain S-box n=1 Tax=Halovivax ruber (strain DSM 18193 / JCM 13892 / XH-70) TaxID=797302 RepID=L0I954_HALRX|nr:helix-turn-helix domain-containing protein [Halovivax ruber]AGB16140.1 PAS domain S-box [Halovivax ruber XH-70]
MNDLPDQVPTTRIRAVLVGESADVAQLGRTLSRGETLVSVAAVPTADAAIGQSEHADCLVTDPEHVEILVAATDVPIVSVSSDDAAPLEEGAADVVSPRAPVNVLETRIRNVVDARTGDRDRSARIHGILEASGSAIVLSDADGTIEWVSESVDRLFGYTPAALAGTTIESLAIEPDRETLGQHRIAVADGDADEFRRTTARIRDGTGRLSECTVEVRNRLSDPSLNRLVWTIAPIDGRPSWREGFSADVDAIDDPILTLDDEWIVRRANEAARGAFAVAENGSIGDEGSSIGDEREPVGHEFWTLLSPATVDTWFERLAEARASDSTVWFDVSRPDDGVDSVVAYPGDGSLTVVVHRRDASPIDRYRAELERTTGLLDEMADPAVLVDDGRITAANAAVFEYTSHATVVGRPTETLVGDRIASEITARAGAPVRRVDPIEWRPSVDGREHVVLLTVGTVADDQTAVVGRDVTDERRLLDGTRELGETIDAVESVSTVEATRRTLLAGIVSVTGATVGGWYRRDGDRLSPRTSIGPTQTERAPTITVATERVNEMFSDGPTRLPRSVRVPITAATTMAGPLAIPVTDTDVILVGTVGTDGEAIDTESASAESPQNGQTAFDAGSEGEGGDLVARYSADDWLTPTVGPGPERTVERDAFGSLFRSVVHLSLARARCLDKTRELTASVSLGSELRDRVVTLAEHRESTYRKLTSARTRQAVERALCDSMADLDAVSACWLVAGDADERHVREAAGSVARSESGVDPATTDSFDLLVERALTAGDQQIERIDLARTDSGSRPSAAEGPVRIATPFDDPTGPATVLVVQASIHDESVFPEYCTELVTVVGLAIDAITAQRALHADDTLEVELSFPTATDDPLTRLVAEIDRSLTVDSVVLTDDHVTSYLTVAQLDEASFVAAVGDVSATTLVNSYVGENGTLHAEIAVEESELFELIRAHDGVLSGLSPRDDRLSLRLELPATRDVRGLVDSIRATFPNAELRARRPVSPRGPDQPVGTLLSTLTDRQREILRTAYAAGYFESPRERTGEEIAETLGISQPTFTRHFRAAERTIFGTLFDQNSGEPSEERGVE